MLYTSCEANKLLKKLNDELNTLFRIENNSCTFRALATEDPNAARPDYNFKDTQSKILVLQDDICRLKHAINLFNTTTILDTIDGKYTIDEALVRLPMLQREKEKLEDYKTKLPKTRYNVTGNGVVDYLYTNYTPEEVMTEYGCVVNVINDLQLQLDIANSTLQTIEY